MSVGGAVGGAGGGAMGGGGGKLSNIGIIVYFNFSRRMADKIPIELILFQVRFP